MSKRTPGPWLVLPKQKHQNFLEVVHTDTKTVGAASGVIARVTHRITWHDEQEANAHLIAAAPDLLEELKDLCGAISSINASRHQAIVMDGDLCYWQREEWVKWMLDEILPHARAVIDKATGDQS